LSTRGYQRDYPPQKLSSPQKLRKKINAELIDFIPENAQKVLLKKINEKKMLNG